MQLDIFCEANQLEGIPIEVIGGLEPPIAENQIKEMPALTAQDIDSFVPERDLVGGFRLDAPVPEKIDASIDSIRNEMADGKTCIVLCSFGKDSSILLQCATIALQLERESGNTDSKLVVASSLVGGAESKLMSDFMTSSLEKVREYAEKHDLPIFVHSVRPNWSENYLLQLLVGRAGIVHAGQNRSCSEDMKEKPLNRMLAQLKDMYPNQVNLMGMYFQESAARREKMLERGDRADKLRVETDGMYLSPLAAFNANEVIDLVGRLSVTSFGIPVEFGSHTVTESPVDFGRVSEIYTSASASSCTIEAIRDAGVKGGTGCSSRTGCHLCCQISDDKSAKNIIDNTGDEATKLLYEVRKVMKASQYRLDQRTWLFKTITEEGQVKIEPGSLSPDFIKKLLRFWLTVQAETGHEIIREDELLWVAVNWARYGIGSALEAIAIWQDIMVDNARYYPTEEDKRPGMKAQIPKGRFFDITDEEYGMPQHGVRNLYVEGIEEFIAPEVYNVDLGVFPYMVEYLENEGRSASEAMSVGLKFVKIVNQIRRFKTKAKKLGWSLEDVAEGIDEIKSKLDIFEEFTYNNALSYAGKKLKKVLKKKPENLLPKRNGEGFDQMDGAFFLFVNGKAIKEAHEAYPDLKPGESFKTLQRLGLNLFSSSGLKTSEDMIQRANLIHRKGLVAHLGNQQKVIEILDNVSELKLA